MVEDMSDVIGLLASGTYTVTRPGPVSLATGFAVAAAGSTFQITASIQPASMRSQELLPEGYRGRDTRACWTQTQLRCAIPPGQVGDVVTVDGEAFEVAAVDPWGVLGNYCKALLVRVRT